jgi:RimJ/RimL family protein N-acetyltransferase
MERISPMDIPPDDLCWIRTVRLTLKPISRLDAQALYPVLADPALYQFTGGEPPASESELADILQRREARRSPAGDEVWLNWVAHEAILANAVGYVQATISSMSTRLAWVVGSRWQRRGFASEMARAVVEWLEERGAPDIEACVHPDHVASEKVAVRAGLRPTGKHHDGEQLWSRRPAR